MTQHPTPRELPQVATSAPADSMPDLSQLRKEHADLAAVAVRLRKLVERDVPPDVGELYELRMRFTSLLIHHLKTEDWLLYPRLLHSGGERAAATARAFSASMGELASNFRDYAGRWGATAIARDWTGYQGETLEILRVLTLRIAREDRDLFPLVERVGKAKTEPC